jgi:hypothetical protein
MERERADDDIKRDGGGGENGNFFLIRVDIRAPARDGTVSQSSIAF